MLLALGALLKVSSASHDVRLLSIRVRNDKGFQSRTAFVVPDVASLEAEAI
jgi:hypothetical protein